MFVYGLTDLLIKPYSTAKVIFSSFLFTTCWFVGSSDAFVLV